MRLAVCEAPAKLMPGDDAWQRLVRRTNDLGPDLFLLNEMPFGRWVSAEPEPSRELLLVSHRLHEEGLEHVSDLRVGTVLGTRAVFEGERSVNQAFVWSANAGVMPVHTKQFFPDEAGYYEARWFERGELRFRVGDANGLKVGFLICTDVMFNEWARHYGRSGAHLIAVPRATPQGSVERWKTMMRAAAIVSGCYVASSNRTGVDDCGQEFAGRGWIVDPSGEVIAETSAENPVVAADVDRSVVEEAKRDYPCYVEDLPV